MATYRILYQVETTETSGTVLLKSFETECAAQTYIKEQEDMAKGGTLFEQKFQRSRGDK
jgi:hypothetical protein